MSHLSNDRLFELVDDTLKWGSDVAEMWAGTQYEKNIDLQQSQILKALEQNDLEKVQKLVYDFAQFLDHAEREYQAADEL